MEEISGGGFIVGRWSLGGDRWALIVGRVG